MAEYTELLSDYFTGSRQNDANKKQQALEKIIETLEHETEQEWNSVLSEDLHALTPPDNDIEKVIELFNDMTEYLEMNESKFFTVEVPYNRVLYRYQKDHLNNFELHFSKLSEKNKYLLLLNYETTVEYRLAQMQQIQFKPETWDNLYWHYSVQTYDSAVSKEAMMSFLETKASKSVIATQAADKELTEGTWTQESLNQYIQAGADLRALRASAALYAQIKAFELLSEGFTKEELAQDVENIVSNYWFSTKADPEFKFLKYLIENKYSFATTFSESNMWLGARGRTPLMWSLTALDEKFFNFLMAQNIDLNINYIHSETQESVLSLVLMRAKENIFQIDKMKRLIEKGATITENLQSDFVEILFLDNEIDYIRDLANSGKISYANIFNLIYKEPTALTATYILSFIRKNNPDFKLTEEEAQRALSHLIKSENRNVIEMLLQMGANPATLSKEDMMSFVRKAYHFETYAEERANDLNNGRMFRVVEELFVNDQIPLTSVFDIIFHSFEKKQANVSSYLLILIQKHHEKFQLSDADAAQFFTELMLQKHTIGDSLVSQFVFFGVAKYLIQNRLNAIQLNKDEAQLLALLAIKNKNSELISEFVKNKKLSLNELFSYIDNVEAADNEDFILNTVLEIDPKFIPTSDLFYQAFVRFTRG